MSLDPIYNFYRYAFKDEPIFIDNPESKIADSSFGDTVVKKAFAIAKDNDLAAEASVVMILVMEIHHQLQLIIESCRGGDDGARAVDIAAAFWVGTGQEVGNNDSGYLMYSIAERAAALYGQDSGVATVNTKILSLLQEVKVLLGSCSSNDDDFGALRMKVDQITTQMYIPLLQQIIYYMNMADSEDNDYENYIELYALSTIPQIAACNPSTFSYLKDELIDYDWEPDGLENVMASLRGAYSCFGLTCEDLGTLQNDGRSGMAMMQPCSDEAPSLSMGGYHSSSDVTQV